VDRAKTVRLLGEEIAVKAHIHTLGGFSAHADQKGLLDWLSHILHPQLEVFINHGEEKVSMGFAQLLRERFHVQTTVPQWREKKVLFSEVEVGIPEGAREAVPPETSFSTLLNHLDRTYKRLRRKLKREKKREGDYDDPKRLRQLEEINRRLEDLEEEL